MTQVNSILIIDDDPLFLLLVKKTIMKYEFAKTISAFSNGLEAFDELKQKINEPAALPDIILLDINMPIMDGWEFLDQFLPFLEKTAKKISIYIATSSIAEDDKKKAKTYPTIIDYLLKPIDQPILAKIIEAHNQ
ncbi:MAG: response regulator [Bacteroidetes bacterium]|nr:response regulator [Bacteroidota bacterium]